MGTSLNRGDHALVFKVFLDNCGTRVCTMLLCLQPVWLSEFVCLFFYFNILNEAFCHLIVKMFFCSCIFIKKNPECSFVSSDCQYVFTHAFSLKKPKAAFCHLIVNMCLLLMLKLILKNWIALCHQIVSFKKEKEKKKRKKMQLSVVLKSTNLISIW